MFECYARIITYSKRIINDAGTFVVYNLASSEQSRVALEWIGFNLFVLTGETVFRGTIVQMFFLLVRVIASMSLMIVAAWIKRSDWMSALKSTKAGKLRQMITGAGYPDVAKDLDDDLVKKIIPGIEEKARQLQPAIKGM